MTSLFRNKRWVQFCRKLRRVLFYMWGTVIIDFAINAIANFTTMPMDTPLSKLLIIYLAVTYPIPFFTCLGFLGLLTFISWIADPGDTTPSTVFYDLQNRKRMLGRLRRSYSELMSQLLQGATWLELGISDKSDAVQSATNFLLRVESRPEQPLPPGTPITQAYDEAEHELLILGEPGAGKSMLLLDLAQQLVRRSETDEKHPLPVILPLSSWAVKRLPLQDWIAEQLTEIYDIPDKLSVEWVKEGRVLPLLDGLDEMEERARPACITAINVYHRDHTTPLVVCSRTTEYKEAAEVQRLVLHNAVVVQPLTHKQVQAYLKQASKSLVALRRVLSTNKTLAEIATTPLMVHVLILTYQGISVRQLPRQYDHLQQQIWTDYLKRMIERKVNKVRYSYHQTCTWLGWLAQQMRDHDQTDFYIEHLQPDWLTGTQQRTYDWLGVRLPAIMVGVLVSIIVGWFIPVAGWLPLSEWQQLLRDITIGGVLGELLRPMLSNSRSGIVSKTRQWQGKPLCLSIGTGLVIGLSMGGGTDQWLRDGLIFGVPVSVSLFLLQKVLFVSPPRFLSWFLQLHFWRGLLVALFIGSSYGMSYRIYYILSVGSSIGQGYGMSNVLRDGLRVGISNGLGAGFCFGVTSILISTILRYLQEGIHLNERVKVRWRNLRKVLFTSSALHIVLPLALILAIAFGLMSQFQYGYEPWTFGLSNGLSYGLSFGLLSWLLLGLSRSVEQERIEDKDRRVFNEGIKRSLNNGWLLGSISGGMIVAMGLLAYELTFALGAGATAGSRFGLSNALSQDLGNGLNYGLSYWLDNFWTLFIASSILAWVITGGLMVWRHYLIRFLLGRAQTFPWKAYQFLEDAKTRILLRYLRSGYSFTHRLLLDFLADTYELESENL